MTAQTDYQQTLDIAMGAVRAGRLDEADHLLQHASQLDPSAAIPYFLLGANAAEAGRVDGAESAFIACLSRAPNLAIARFQLGLLQMTNGRPGTAASTWEPLFLLDDQQPLKHFAAGMIDITRGQPDSARQRIEAGIELNQANPALNKDMQGVLARLAGLAGNPSAPSTMQEPAAAGTVDDETSTEHVLLSGYRQA